MSDLIRYRLAGGEHNVYSIARDELTRIETVPLPGKPAYFGERDVLYRMPEGMYLLLHVRTWQNSVQAIFKGASVDDRTHDAEILTPNDAAGWLCERGFEDKAAEIRKHMGDKRAEGAEAMPEGTEQPARHSLDFRSVFWYGAKYAFTSTQAACVKILWEHWERETPIIGEPELLDAAGSGGEKLKDVFEKGKHPAWGTMIVSARKGTFRLQEPEKD
jgi:hypothetical protein